VLFTTRRDFGDLFALVREIGSGMNPIDIRFQGVKCLNITWLNMIILWNVRLNPDLSGFPQSNRLEYGCHNRRGDLSPFLGNLHLYPSVTYRAVAKNVSFTE
jgi:hypothetical protein